MPVPPYSCHGCGHAAQPNHNMLNPHACDDPTSPECPCEGFVYAPGDEASEFEGGGGSSGGGGASGSW